MNFEVEYIEKLAKLIDEKSLSEIVLEDGEQAITIKREINQTVVQAQAPIVAAPAPQVAPQTAVKEAPQETSSAPKGTPVTSPMVGAFYAAPSPGAKPFVKVGDTVSAGQVVCIVED